VTRPRRQIEIVFLLAGGEARRAELLPLAREVLERADFSRLAGELADRRLLPLIGSRAVEAAPDLVTDTFREDVAAARAGARAHGLAIEATTARLAEALAGAGVRALSLKGPLLAAEAHGDIGLRQTSDIDLLVPAERLDDAARVLCEQGYSEPSDVRRAGGLPDLHFELTHPGRPSVDLHWRVHWYERAFSDKLLTRAKPGPDGLLRAQPDDLVASLLLYFARDGFHGVRVAADLAAWWDRHGDALPTGFLEGHAAAYPQLAAPLSSAAVAVERLTGVPSVGWLGDGLELGKRARAAIRLADWTQSGDRDQLSANISLVGALLRPPGSLSEFARREFVLPEGPRASAIHAAKFGARYGLALWKVRGGRQWADPPAGVSVGAPPAPRTRR
jgi:hypothetical protein